MLKEKKISSDKSVASKVKEILSGRPFIVNALRQQIVNYSALSRLICREIMEREGEMPSVEAVKAALMREKDKVVKKRSLQEERVLKLLRNTKINLQDKIAVLISKNKLSIPSIISADLTTHHIYIVDQTKLNASLSEEISKDVKIDKDLVALIFKSPKEIENTPGVVAFISQLLAGQNINVKEFLSCYTDTLIVLNPEDALKAFSLLQKHI